MNRSTSTCRTRDSSGVSSTSTRGNTPSSSWGLRARTNQVNLTRGQKFKRALHLMWATRFGWYWMYIAARMALFSLVLFETLIQFVWWQMKSDSILRAIPYRGGKSNTKKLKIEKEQDGEEVDISKPQQTSESDDFDEDGTKAKNSRAFLDLHFPVPTADVVSRKQGDDYKFPVVVCVTGGGWLVGSHFWAGFIGRIFADNGYLVVGPDYRNFPQATVSDMVDDVTDSIAWTFENIERYGGDLSRVTLMGQSAGSHLLFLSMCHQAQLLAAGLEPKYNPAKAMRVLGLSGLYDLPALEGHLHSRGLYRALQDIMFEGKDLHTRQSFSPLHLLREQIDVETFDAYFPREFLILHGTRDRSAPIEESEKLHNLLVQKCAEVNVMRGDTLEATQWRSVELIKLEGATHTSPYMDEPWAMRSSIVAMLCERDNMPEPRVFESRKPLAGRRRLAFASKYLLTF